MTDRSNGYEAVADLFASRRQSRLGVAEVIDWAATLPQGAAVLDIGCGHGVPISEALIAQGCEVYAVDASPRMVAAFRERFPGVVVSCEAIEDSPLFNRQFDGVVAWGVMFLMALDVQARVITNVARALKPQGSFLFTSPRQECSWPDMLTGHESISPGADAYRRLLSAAGVELTRELDDDGDNHYYVATNARDFERKNRSGGAVARR